MDKEKMLEKLNKIGWKYFEDNRCVKFEFGNRAVEYDRKDVRMYIRGTSSTHSQPAYIPINELELMISYFKGA